MSTPTAPATVPAGHVDITPAGCDLFAQAGATGPVLLLNAAASPEMLLGFVHGRCRELLALASMAACGRDGEAELRAVAHHLRGGLETVLAGLDALAEQLPSASPKSSAGGHLAAGVQVQP
ncbi:hypothetical protein [Aquabacterium sp. A08]|uniref:hypothetical protein n=1 Tax=Aquabacterium sp. A08 TaxID=2718532 RepID=UPI00141F52C7|nr:hypothetical protein [Aquabacterium sp. A08]NIC43112.1 hypothetical protein [Aquabacterium sp. A08]